MKTNMAVLVELATRNSPAAAALRSAIAKVKSATPIRDSYRGELKKYGITGKAADHAIDVIGASLKAAKEK